MNNETQNTMPSIRIGRKDTLKIEVNDAGEYIELNFADRSFINKFWELGKQLEKYSKELEGFKVELDENGEMTAETQENLLNKDYEYNKKIAEQIDRLFGAGTCRKVFAVDVPSVDLVTEFICALMPFMEKEVQKRKASISNKYAANRRGGRR